MTASKPVARRKILGAGLALGAAAAGYVLLPGNQPGQTLFATASAQTSDETAPIEVPDMVLGDPDAPIEFIEYSSFTCPHCARFHKEVYPLLKANYIETGKIKLVYREVYFDRPGLWASMIARCGGAERFFGMTELIFERQTEWSRLPDAPSIIKELFSIGRVAGLEEDAMNVCIRDEDMAKALYANYQDKAGAHGIDSTPSFIINGEKFANMSYEDFENILKGLLDG